MTKKVERKLASVKEVTSIKPIPDADFIEAVIVDNGWQVVERKGRVSVGELVVFAEPDSIIPHNLAPFLSRDGEPKEYNGVKGERLRTVKLKKTLSQGLIFKLSELPEAALKKGVDLGADLTEVLNITKWEAPIPACLSGQVRGNFPSFLQKTDQERCLSEGALVETSLGKMTIKTLCEGELQVLVKSFNVQTGQVEMKRVKGFSIMSETDQDWFCLTTKGGKRLIATGDHRVWCEDIQSYRRMRDIQSGQLVVTL
jgi:hypothetical protein